jgi:CheY-like chemotaxis protein
MVTDQVTPDHKAGADGTRPSDLLPAERSAAIPATILVVDDEPDVLELAVELLESWGHSTVAVQDPRIALAILEGRQKVDLLFTDIVMPGDLNGIELAERALMLRPDLRVLLTSGYLSHPKLRSRTPGGESAFLAKPYRPKQLAECVGRLLVG